MIFACRSMLALFIRVEYCNRGGGLHIEVGVSGCLSITLLLYRLSDCALHLEPVRHNRFPNLKG